MLVGGDGTVNEVVNGIGGEHGVELAVIARGTGWDFVRTYGIPRGLDEAIAVALQGRTRTVDVGRATYRAWNGGESSSYFANIASAGMSGAVAKRANETTKALGGKVSYLWATFAVFSRWRNSEVTVDVDGETRRGRMHDVVVANGRYFGGGMMICPDAKPDDGLLDVLLIGDLIVALTAVPADGTARHYVGGEPHCPTADWQLVHAAVHAAKELGQPLRVGPIASSDTFYDPDRGRHGRWSERGVLGVEMEAAVLFTLGALRGVQAGCLLTVSDVVIGEQFTRISDEDLQAAVDRMTRVALATVTTEKHR